jgi:ABC-2 type transport system ATP-binding protein
MGRKQLMGRVPEVLERVGVLDRKRQLVGHLSRGLRQRVGLAVALLPNPKVLILDEPTSGLDPLQRAEVRTLIRELAGEHTVLLSSHILAEVESMSDRVIILREGRVVADGAREELIATLGGRGHVRLEAVVGDAEAARDLLATLPGVEDVQITERVGIHDGFTLSGSGDLREDVGALAAMKGWALRELSEVRPTLESLFASLVVGDGSIAPAPRPAPAPAPVSLSVEPIILDGSSGMGLDLMPLAPAVEAPSLGTPGQKENFYSLNPFDGGGSRDLSKPVGSGDTQDEGCEDEEDEA